MNPPKSNLENNWFTIDEIDPSTFGISEYGQWMKLHSYLFIGKEKAILADSGLGVGNIRTIVDSLTQLPVQVITTHAHWDHTGGHHLFDWFSAHALESEWIEKGFEREAKEIGEWLVKEPFTKEAPPQFDIEQYRPFQGKVENVHSDGDVFDLGGRHMEIIHTPGHSPGHVCIYDEARGYLVTADLLYQGVLLGGLKYSDPLDFQRSLLRLKALPHIKALLPGHGRLNIDNDLLDEAVEAFETLAGKGLLKKKSGLHQFARLKISL
jgi:glyoxylase-like metal-dependent hydrolase (beta-lactamase superfamily II)